MPFLHSAPLVDQARVRFESALALTLIELIKILLGFVE